MKQTVYPKYKSQEQIKSSVIKETQRFRSKHCGYSFTVLKEGKNIDYYYLIKALQRYIKGVTYREIERILGGKNVWIPKK